MLISWPIQSQIENTLGIYSGARMGSWPNQYKTKNLMQV
jgi:hypothetical protein